MFGVYVFLVVVECMYLFGLGLFYEGYIVGVVDYVVCVGIFLVNVCWLIE